MAIIEMIKSIFSSIFGGFSSDSSNSKKELIRKKNKQTMRKSRNSNQAGRDITFGKDSNYDK